MRVLSALSGAGSSAFIYLGQQLGVTGYLVMGMVAGVITIAISAFYDVN